MKARTLVVLLTLVAGSGLAQARSAGVASLSGAVFDSLALGPLAGAAVQLAQVGADGRVVTTWSTQSDAEGRYAFPSLPLGSFLLGFEHVALDSLGLRAPVHRVDVREPGALRVALATPHMSTVVRAACGAAGVRDSLSLLVGSVRDATNDGTVRDAFVSAKWAEVTLIRGRMLRDLPTRDMRSNDDGWFSACVPSSVPVTIYAERDSLRSGDVTVTLSTTAVRRRDLYVGRVRVAIATADSVATSGVVEGGSRLLTTGEGRVSGRVRGRDGRPLPNARVGLSTGRAETITDSTGMFTLPGVPFGTYTIEARAIGYFPEEAMVDIVAFRESPVDILLVALTAAQLDTVRVAARGGLEFNDTATTEIYTSGGVGTFFDESHLDTLKVNTFSDILRQVPGVTFVEGMGPADGFERRILMRARSFIAGGNVPGNAGAGFCIPALFIDGIKLIEGATDFDNLVNVGTIRRIEVYPSGLTVPAEFHSQGSCGVIAIWLGPNRRPRVVPPKGAP